MLFRAEILSKESWIGVWESYHKDGFGEHAIQDGQTCTYPIILKSGDDELVAYATVKELDAETANINFGCVFSKYRKLGFGYEVFKEIVKEIENKYKRITFICRTKNVPMIKLGLNEGFEIIGIRKIYNLPHIEFMKEA